MPTTNEDIEEDEIATLLSAQSTSVITIQGSILTGLLSHPEITIATHTNSLSPS